MIKMNFTRAKFQFHSILVIFLTLFLAKNGFRQALLRRSILDFNYVLRSFWISMRKISLRKFWFQAHKSSGNRFCSTILWRNSYLWQCQRSPLSSFSLGRQYFHGSWPSYLFGVKSFKVFLNNFNEFMRMTWSRKTSKFTKIEFFQSRTTFLFSSKSLTLSPLSGRRFWIGRKIQDFFSLWLALVQSMMSLVASIRSIRILIDGISIFTVYQMFLLNVFIF